MLDVEVVEDLDLTLDGSQIADYRVERGTSNNIPRLRV